MRILLCLLAFSALAGTGELHPEGTPLPRNLTAEERALIAEHPIRAPRGSVTPPPTGPIEVPGEYAPMAGILLAYEGPGDWLEILDQMAANITTIGEADVYVMCDSTFEAEDAFQFMVNAGADPSRVNTLVVPGDSIWMRDYGPRYVYEGDVRIVIDHTYNRPRPNDNNVPTFFADVKNHQRYELPLVHGGGNYHLHDTARAHTTRLINNENPGFTETEIRDIWNQYQGTGTSFYDPLPQSVDATQHIDMWMQAIGDTEVIISDWPFDEGSIQDQICDATAVTLANEGFTVHRIPARLTGGQFGATHYTYTNVVMCNDLVLLPRYTNTQVTQHNAEALAVWQAAVPDKTVVQIDCEAIVVAAGVMHCIAMHLPAAKGNGDPTVYLQTRPDGETFDPGDLVPLSWISDDDESVDTVALELSIDGGTTWTDTLVSDQPARGQFLWNVPDVFAPNARLRAVVRDGDGNMGTDVHTTNFAIQGEPPCEGDVAGDDNTVDATDLMATFPNWRQVGGSFDIDMNGTVDLRDMLRIIANYGVCTR